MTRTAPLDEHRGLIEVIELDSLSPGTAYECELSYKTGPAPAVSRARFRTAPGTSREISFLLGSCNWNRGGLLKIGDAKAAWEGIRDLVEAVDPDFMIHCGDQIYADIPGLELKYMTLRYYRELYQKSWGTRPTAQALAALPHYMMLDDHEIFDNFYNGKPYTGENSEGIRGFALRAYTEYQHSRNPQRPPAGNAQDQYYFSFDYGGVQVFALASVDT